MRTSERRRAFLPVLLSLLPVLVLALAIFLFSCQPSTDSSRTSGSVTRFLLRLFYGGCEDLDDAALTALCASLEHTVRKIAHFTEYTVFGISLLMFVYVLRRCIGCADALWRTALPISWLIGTLYAATDELHQFFVPGRSPGLKDICIDSSGVLTGALLCCLFIALLRHLREKKKGTEML